MRNEIFVDNFAGGGGASTGIEEAIGRSVDIAINHDECAIAMHKANHPTTKHYQEDVWQVDPVEACAGRPVALAWFSPDCKHFSKALGGKPRDKKIRGLAWVAVKWAKLVKPRVIMMENVEEIQTWGPLLPNGKPDPARIGHTYNRFVHSIKALGYQVETRELVAADYGAPTTRKRWFMIARCDGKPIVWPEPTHIQRKAMKSLISAINPNIKPWVPVADILDWSLPCPSIFDTKDEIKAKYGVNAIRPLRENTLKRIARGIQKFVINNPDPFIINMKFNNEPESVHEPLSTVTSINSHLLVAPSLIQYHQERRDESPRGQEVNRPLLTQDGSNRYALVAPTLVQTGYGERKGQKPRCNDVQEPLGTVVSAGKHALVCAFMHKYYGGGYTGAGTDIRDPAPTVTAVDHNSLACAYLTQFNNNCIGQPVTEPINTITAGEGHFGEVRAFLLKYYGNEGYSDCAEPMPTQTSKDRFGLVTIYGEEYAIADIGLRMLTPRELFDAQGFPHNYKIERGADGRIMTKAEQVAKGGNAVCPQLPAALVRANLPEYCDHKERRAV